MPETRTIIDRVKLIETESEMGALTGIGPFKNYPETVTCPCCGKTYMPSIRQRKHLRSLQSGGGSTSMLFAATSGEVVEWVAPSG